MAKKNEKTAEKPAGKISGKKLLDAAKKHQDALLAVGLHEADINKLEQALRGLESSGKDITVATQALVKDLSRVIEDFQNAIRKEFPGNASFHAFFKAGEPMPTEAHAVLALGRTIAKEAPDFSANLIKYALNAASVKHVTYLCDQLEKALGGANPQADAEAAEAAIREAAMRAFEGKPEMAAFGK